MLPRRTFLKSAAFSLASLGGGVTRPFWADEIKQEAEPIPVPPSSAPCVEVVFCLDTTGSMGGLIEGAKQKIWAICNQIISGRPSPDLKVGLVAFRDRGDEYITKVIDLSDDLDAIHSHLREFKAAGGGDIPESVNQALDDAVNKIHWSRVQPNDETLRIIFLVGDAPPHMDYPDDVKYPVTCEKACRLGILINTIQCGNDVDCTKFWQDICKRAEGQFVKIAQDGGVQVVATPYDRRLAEINNSLASTTLAFGDRRAQAESQGKAKDAQNLAPAAAAERALFNARKEQCAVYDLLDAVKQGRIKLEDIKPEHLPTELQGKTLAEQRKILDEMETKRTELRREALELDKKRSEFLTQKMEETKGRDGFDQQVMDMLRRQAKKARIAY